MDGGEVGMAGTGERKEGKGGEGRGGEDTRV